MYGPGPPDFFGPPGLMDRPFGGPPRGPPRPSLLGPPMFDDPPRFEPRFDPPGYEPPFEPAFAPRGRGAPGPRPSFPGVFDDGPSRGFGSRFRGRGGHFGEEFDYNHGDAAFNGGGFGGGGGGGGGGGLLDVDMSTLPAQFGVPVDRLSNMRTRKTIGHSGGGMNNFPQKRSFGDSANLYEQYDVSDANATTFSEDDSNVTGYDFTTNKYQKVNRGFSRGARGRGRGKGSGSVLATLGAKLDQMTALKLGLDYDEIQAALKSADDTPHKPAQNMYSGHNDYSGAGGRYGEGGDSYNNSSRGGFGRGGFGRGGRGGDRGRGGRGGDRGGRGGDRGGRGGRGFGRGDVRGGRGGDRGRGRGDRGGGRGGGRGDMRGARGAGGRGGARGVSARGAGARGAGARGRGVAFNRGGNLSSSGGQAGAVAGSRFNRGTGRLTVNPKHVFSEKKDIDFVSVRRALETYSSLLKSYPKGSDYVITIESAGATGQPSLYMGYIVEELLQHQGKTIYTGVLSCGGAFLARSVGTDKNVLKQNTYKMAYELLVMKPLDYAVSARDPGADWIKSELQTKFGISVDVAAGNFDSVYRKPPEEYDSSKHLMTGTVVVKDAQNVNVDRQMQVLQERLRTTTKNPRAQEQNQTVCILDSFILQAKLFPVLLIRGATTSAGATIIHADLYINDIVIATGSSSNKKEAQQQVYEAAWLTLKTTQLHRILRTFIRNDPYAYTGSDLLDIMVKGTNKIGMNNLRLLFSSKVPVFQNWRDKSELIIVDWHNYAGNRRSNAFHILNMSATASGLYLEWSFEKRQCEADCRHAAGCFLKLQRETFGYAVCSSKWYARNEAALNALRKVYVTQPIVAVEPATDFSIAIPYTEFAASADLYAPPRETTDPEVMTEFEKTKPYIYLLHLLRKSYEEKKFTGVMLQNCPEDFRKEIHKLWPDRGLMMDIVNFENHTYLCFGHNQEIRPVYDAMIAEGVTSKGIYRIIKSTDITDIY